MISQLGKFKIDVKNDMNPTILYNYLEENSSQLKIVITDNELPGMNGLDVIK